MAHPGPSTARYYDEFDDQCIVTITRKQLPVLHNSVAHWETQRDVRVATKPEFFALIAAAAPDLLELPWQEWCINDTTVRTGIMVGAVTEGEDLRTEQLGNFAHERGSFQMLDNKVSACEKNRQLNTSLEGRDVDAEVFGGAVNFADNDWHYHTFATTALPEPADMMVTAHGLFHDPKVAKLFNNATFAMYGQSPKVGIHKSSAAWDMLTYYGLIDENPAPGTFGNERLNAMIEAVDQVFDKARQKLDGYKHYYIDLDL